MRPVYFLKQTVYDHLAHIYMIINNNTS